jgi:polysaccharide biosynthesis transport protein
MESTESFRGIEQYWLIVKRRWVPATAVFGSVLVVTALKIVLQQPIYQAQAKVSFTKNSPTSSLTGLGKEIAELAPVAEQSNPLNTEIEIMRSAAIAQKSIKKFNLKDEKLAELKTKDFLKKLSVVHTRGSDLLTISYQSKDPNLAAQVVSYVIESYLQTNQLVNNSKTNLARQFLEQQVPKAESAVRQAEANLRKFKEENKVILLQEEARMAVETMADLQRQIALAQSELADANAQFRTFQTELRMNAQQALTATSLSQSPGVGQALQQYQQVGRQLALERTRFQESHPVIADLKSKEASLKALLEQEINQVAGHEQQVPPGNLQLGEVKPNLIEEFVKIEAKRQGYTSQVAALTNQQAAYKQRLSILPKLEQQQRELENKLQLAQSTYSLVSQKLQEIRILENQNVGNARVVQPATIPDEAIAPRKAVLLGMGILLGSLLGLGTALVLEARDRSIATVEEAKALFNLALLGVIPDYRKAQKTIIADDPELLRPQIVVEDNPRSTISGAYQMLQANLKFLSSDRQIKAIVVTSCVPQEGKSTVCANLALAVAQLGRKVLLIDADLHRPVQHRIWELTNQVGLSHAIAGQSEINSAIAQPRVNLKVLPAGVIPPNPLALLDSMRLASLIEDFSAAFDLVIIDAPSLQVAADALILGKKADGILLVARPGVVDVDSAAFAKELLYKSDQHVLGLVVNGVMPQNEPYSYYYFSDRSYAPAVK